MDIYFTQTQYILWCSKRCEFKQSYRYIAVVVPTLVPTEIRTEHLHNRSWDSSVGIATGYGGLIPVRCKLLSLLHSIQTGSGPHPASYPMGAGALFPGAKHPGREADHFSPSSAEVKKGGAIPPLSHMPLCHSA
jgi:hypothetical protein